MTEIGKFRHRVTVERETTASNGLGAFVRTWAVVGDRWAQVTPTGGREGLINGSLTTQQNYRVAMRFDTSVTNGDRLVWNGKSLRIESVEDVDGRRATMVAYCSFVVDEDLA